MELNIPASHDLSKGCSQDTVVSWHAKGMCLDYSRCLFDLLAVVASLFLILNHAVEQQFIFILFLSAF